QPGVPLPRVRVRDPPVVPELGAVGSDLRVADDVIEPRVVLERMWVLVPDVDPDVGRVDPRSVFKPAGGHHAVAHDAVVAAARDGDAVVRDVHDLVVQRQLMLTPAVAQHDASTAERVHGRVLRVGAPADAVVHGY